MSFHQNYSESDFKKAMHWLNKQDHNWPQHIKDKNIAVQMYLKSQKKEESSFNKELEPFLSQETGAVSTDFKQSPSAPAPVQKNSQTCYKKPTTFTLDKKSLQALDQIKKEFNIQSDEEALRLIIQLGLKSLNRL